MTAEARGRESCPCACSAAPRRATNHTTLRASKEYPGISTESSSMEAANPPVGSAQPVMSQLSWMAAAEEEVRVRMCICVCACCACLAGLHNDQNLQHPLDGSRCLSHDDIRRWRLMISRRSSRRRAACWRNLRCAMPCSADPSRALLLTTRTTAHAIRRRAI